MYSTIIGQILTHPSQRSEKNGEGWVNHAHEGDPRR